MEILALFSHKVPRRVNHVFMENRFFGKKSARRRKTSVFLSRTHKAAGQTPGGTRYCQLCKSVGRGGALLRPMGRCKSAQHSVGADDSVGPINIADSPQISEKALLSVGGQSRPPLQRLRVYLKTPNAPGQRAFLRCAASFFLEIRQYSCEKMSCATQKSLAAGHIMSFQIHPRKPLRFSWIFPAKLKAAQNF